MAPIHDAGQRGDVEELMRVVEVEGVEVVDLVDDHGRTALHHASSNGHIDVTTYLLLLLTTTTTINHQDHDGTTALQGACSSGHAVITSLLLSHHADPTLTNNMKHTPLTSASVRGHEEVVKLLLKEKRVRGRIDDQNAFGQTALWLASYEEHVGVVKVRAVVVVVVELWQGHFPPTYNSSNSTSSSSSSSIPNNRQYNTDIITPPSLPPPSSASN